MSDDELSLEELRELCTTRYVDPFYYEDSELRVETVRGVSLVQDENLMSEAAEALLKVEDVVLHEKNCVNVEASPAVKKIARERRDVSSVVSTQKDDAMDVLKQIQEATVSELLAGIAGLKKKCERLQYSTKYSEKALCEFLLCNPDQRPVSLTVICRKLDGNDFAQLIQTLIGCSDVPKRRSIVRLTLKMEINLANVLKLVDKVISEQPDVEMAEEIATAMSFDVHTHQLKEKMKTSDLRQLAYYENVIEEQVHMITLLTSFTLKIKSAPHVELLVTYKNGLYDKNRRSKLIEIQHESGPQRRRVVFAEETNVSHEYDLPDDAKYLSLEEFMPKVENLVDYLRECVEGESDI